MSLIHRGFPRLLYWFAEVKFCLTVDVIRGVLAKYCDCRYFELGTIIDCITMLTPQGERKYNAAFSCRNDDLPPVYLETADTRLYAGVAACLDNSKIEYSVETEICDDGGKGSIVITKYIINIM